MCAGVRALARNLSMMPVSSFITSPYNYYFLLLLRGLFNFCSRHFILQMVLIDYPSVMMFAGVRYLIIVYQHVAVRARVCVSVIRELSEYNIV